MTYYTNSTTSTTATTSPSSWTYYIDYQNDNYNYQPYITWPKPTIGDTNRKTLRAEDIDITFELQDKTRTSLSLKDYMRFVIVHHKLPEDCKDLEELGKLMNEMKMIEEL